ncbi:MAG: hypothetical protein ACRYHA_20800, partial [Janthinobacterium lividum]
REASRRSAEQEKTSHTSGAQAKITGTRGAMHGRIRLVEAHSLDDCHVPCGCPQTRQAQVSVKA